MSRFGAGLLGNLRRPVFALPVNQMIRQFARVFFDALPPDVAVIGQGHVGEDHVFVQAGHAVGVGVVVGTRGHAKVTGLGVDGHHLAVGLGFDPSDVVANGGDFPAIEAFGWHQHGEVCFAASAGERSCHVVFFSLRIGHAQDEHVFGQPTLFAPHAGGDAQGQALFAQQGIAAVARTV